MEEINKIPVVKNIIQENRINKEDANEDINKLPHLKEYYKNLEDPAVQQEFESLLFPLEKMGYKQKLIFRSFIVFRFQDITEAIDLLSKNNSIWNHKYTVGFNNMCFICDDLEKNHAGYFKNKTESEEEHEFFYDRIDSFRTINIGSEKINAALKLMKSIYSNKYLENDLANKHEYSHICPICFMEFEENNKIILGCKHKFCRDCIVYYLEEEIKNSRINPIRCPEKKCFNAKALVNSYENNLMKEENSIFFFFSDELIKSLVSNQYYGKYLDFKLKLLIEKEKNLTFCPIINCKGYARIDTAEINYSNYNINNDLKILTNSKSTEENYTDGYKIENFNENEKLLAEGKKNNFLQSNTILNVSLDGQNKKKLVCNFNHEFCLRCKNNWNENHNCEKDEELFKYSNENANKLKKCPNCRTWIEKNRGCNHMNCFVCKHEFCWLCMKHCLPDHYNILGTECYGRQFPD
jgi:hypothetical protein